VTPRPLLALLLAAAAFGGCGTGDDRDQARAVVERFDDAVRSGRGEEACAQLSAAAVEQLESQAGERCPAAIAELDYAGGAIVGVEVYVTNAKVDQRGGDSTFLGREPAGWRITAVACRPEDGKPRDRPFACEVEA
jgi:hypothetical protein